MFESRRNYSRNFISLIMLITSKTTSRSVTNSDELIISIPLIIPGTKTHGHDYSMNISEPRILSPRYSKTGVVIGGGGGGIGLGIVAALDKFGGGKKTETQFTGGTNNGPNANRPSDPIGIVVSSTIKYTDTKTKGSEGLGSVEMSTGTTAAAADSVRSMYCGGGIQDERNHRLRQWRQVGVFYESQSPIFYNTSAVFRDYPPSDFLSSCYLCRKKLHGKDIYMYREKAFCCTECRYQQTAADDERKDKKRPRHRNGVSRSSYLEDRHFSPGIMAI